MLCCVWLASGKANGQEDDPLHLLEFALVWHSARLGSMHQEDREEAQFCATKRAAVIQGTGRWMPRPMASACFIQCGLCLVSVCAGSAENSSLEPASDDAVDDAASAAPAETLAASHVSTSATLASPTTALASTSATLAASATAAESATAASSPRALQWLLMKMRVQREGERSDIEKQLAAAYTFGGDIVGAGTFGVVTAGRHRETDKSVVVK